MRARRIRFSIGIWLILAYNAGPRDKQFHTMPHAVQYTSRPLYVVAVNSQQVCMPTDSGLGTVHGRALVCEYGSVVSARDLASVWCVHAEFYVKVWQ